MGPPLHPPGRPQRHFLQYAASVLTCYTSLSAFQLLIAPITLASPDPSRTLSNEPFCLVPFAVCALPLLVCLLPFAPAFCLQLVLCVCMLIRPSARHPPFPLPSLVLSLCFTADKQPTIRRCYHAAEHTTVSCPLYITAYVGRGSTARLKTHAAKCPASILPLKG